jgi:beta-glucanase (GH16 family)
VNPFTVDPAGTLDIGANCVGVGGTPNGGTRQSYDSGNMTTQGSFSQLYGYFEIRAMLPQGIGMWPAFWMLTGNSYLPGNWPPELDVLEAFGATTSAGEGGANQAHRDIHSTNTAQQAGGWATISGNEYTAYHTYGALRTPQLITFFYDENPGRADAHARGLHADDVSDRRHRGRRLVAERYHR